MSLSTSVTRSPNIMTSFLFFLSAIQLAHFATSNDRSILQVLEDITPDLERFGARVAGEIRELGEACEQEPPRLEQYHAWGRRVDRLVTSPAWRAQKIVSAEEGLIATAYDRQHGPWR